MALAISPRKILVLYSIASRQEWIPQGLSVGRKNACYQKKICQCYVSSIFLIQKQDNTSDYINIEIESLKQQTENNFKDSLKVCKQIKENKKSCRTIFYEDLHLKSLKSGNDNDLAQQRDPSVVYSYCLIARLRHRVNCLKFWQYSTTGSSLTIVEEEENDEVVDPVSAEDKHLGKDLQFEPNNADDSTIIRLSKLIPLNKVVDYEEKVRLGVLTNLQEITDLPRNKLQPQPVKVRPNSVTIIVLPGRRKTTKNAQRSRSRNQNPSGVNETPARGIAYQVSDADDINQTPSRNVMVTSIETIFSRTGIPPATTNLMSSIDSEERLAIRRQGPSGSRQQVPTLRPARYPDFADETRRQTSFANWPESSMQDATHMANHGFFFTGRQDLVRCYQCGIGMKDWSETDEPLFEHIRHSPECSFLLELLGPELLAAYKVNLIPSGAQPARRSAVNATPDQGAGGFSTSTSGTSSSTTVAASSNVRSPQYSTLESRMQSYRNGWPSSHAQTPTQLSEAGFYFTGYGDVCRCYTCDGGLQRWDPQDDPWIEHARWFPECDHVRQSRGQEYIDLVQRAANQSDEDDDPAVVMQTPGTASITGAMGGLSVSEDSLSSDAAKQALKEGFSKKAVLLAIHELKAKGEKDVTATSIIEVLNSKKARGEALPTDSPPNEAENEDVDSETENDPEYLERENQRLKMIIKCVKCEIRDANILFIPCTHHRMCEECAEDTLLCPACGRDIDKKVKTYMS